MSFATGWRDGEAICRALGVDPKDVYSLTMRVKANEVVQVRVLRFVRTEDTEQLCRLVHEEYTLTRKDPS